MSNITEKMIHWFREKKDQGVTYSMNYRNGPSSYDCSSAMHYALDSAFGLEHTSTINTSTLGQFLESLGYVKITDNTPWDAQAGDIVIWSKWRGVPGASAHTALFTSKDTIIHCNYRNNGITEEAEENKHILYLYKWNYVVYRYTEVTKEQVEKGEEMEQVQERYMVHGKYSIDSLPWWCSDKNNVGTTEDRNGFVVTITRKWGSYWYSQFLGGWVDYRAFIPVENVELTLTVNHGGYSVDTKPWGTAGFKTVMKTDELIGRTLRISAQRGGYYYVHDMAKWIDKRAFN